MSGLLLFGEQTVVGIKNETPLAASAEFKKIQHQQ